MAKDPAFLFYSKDFYEGTRMMLPEERACYIDLLIYQHQNGKIPSDLRRVLMYCSGIDKATLEATLEAKFKQTENGWINETLSKKIQERKEYTSKQSVNGRVGQFWKKAKSQLKAVQLKKLKDFAYNDFGKTELINLINSHKTLEGSLKALLKHLEDVNANEDVDKDLFKNKKEKFREAVFMTDENYQKLILAHGESGTNWMLDKLNSYKQSSGKTYKNDYQAILTWVVDKYQKEKPNEPTINRQTAKVIEQNSRGWAAN